VVLDVVDECDVVDIDFVIGRVALVSYGLAGTGLHVHREIHAKEDGVNSILLVLTDLLLDMIQIVLLEEIPWIITSMYYLSLGLSIFICGFVAANTIRTKPLLIGRRNSIFIESGKSTSS
jgi:hypothetical protein